MYPPTTGRGLWPLRILLCALPACAGVSHRPPPAATGPLPPAAVERELPSLARYSVHSEDAAMELSVEASAPPSLRAAKGVVGLTAPLGDAELQCFVYPGRFDLGRVVQGALDDMLPRARVQRSIVGLRAGQARGRAFVAVRAEYRVAVGQLRVQGDLKIAASAAPDASLLCALNAPGLERTFERVLRGLLASLVVRGAAEPLDAAPREIVRSRSGARSVTLVERDRRQGGDATVLRTTYRTTLRVEPGGAGLVAEDSSHIDRSRDGAVLESNYVRFVGDRRVRDIQLSRMGDTYLVEGQVDGRKIYSAFSVRGGLADTAAQRAFICAARRLGRAPRALSVYAPEVDDLRATALAVEPTQGAATVRLRLGSSNMDATVGERCELVRARVETASGVQEWERLWSSGELPAAADRG